MSQNIIEVTQANAQQVLIEDSHEKLVMVDFWADWCAPCKALMPVLEKLAGEYTDQLTLAKVNADEEQMIAAQFGVRSLPTVMLIKEGQPVDGFMGAQPESAIREMLDKYLPKPWDIALEKAKDLIAQGNLAEALPLARQAYTDSKQRADIAFVLAHVLIELNRCEDAQQILDSVGMVDQDAQYQQLRAQLALKQEAAQTPEVKALQDKLASDPENLDLRSQLALQLSQSGQNKEALELLLEVLRKDLNFQDGAVKAAYMDILASLGKGDPLAVEFQRKIYTLLY